MLRSPDVSRPTAFEPDVEAPSDRPVVVLVDTSSALERRILAAWAERTFEANVTQISITPSRRRRPGARTDPALAARLQRGDDPLVVPARVIWLPDARDGRRSANWMDVLKLGDPRDPDPIRQRFLFNRFPERVGIVAGAPAAASELVAAHASSVEVTTLVDHVTRRAHLTLEQAERRIRGNRYKVPRFLHEEILSRPEFRDRVMLLGAERGIPAELALARARYYLREISASHSTFLIDLIANAIHWVYSQGYGEIVYDHEQIARIGKLGEEYPIAFVPSHRSNLDRLSLQYLLWENDLPPNHTAAGINMNFFPIGPLIRRTGAFFIRRSFRDNALYKYVLKTYLGYLVEKRFPLEWYMEGGRSRTGKLLPPRLGMLGWVVDAVRQGRSEDLFLIPTSIAYDQIQDVHDYAAEAVGGEKRKESLGWAFEAIRSLRRRYGNIHVRFAEPLSVAGEIDLGHTDELDVQKLAFEIMYRISRVTPFTPTSVISTALLATGRSSASAQQVMLTAASIARLIAEEGWPTTEPIFFDDSESAARVLDLLAEHGSVTKDAAGTYGLDQRQAIKAAYYRNTVVHYFLPAAIAEVALVAAPPSETAFWTEVADLRDLLKFEFFFPEREEFARQIEAEPVRRAGDWRERLETGRGSELLTEMPLLRAHWALRPFFEAYRVVADELAATDEPVVDDKDLVSRALDRAGRYLTEGVIVSHESVSKALMQSALGLAHNRGLATGGDRAAFAAEMAEMCDRTAAIGRLSQGRER